MKKLIWLIVFVALAYLAYTQFFPRLGPEEKQVAELEKAFHKASQAFVGASSQLGGAGTAAIADPEAALDQVKEVEKKLAELKPNLTEEAARTRASKLDAKIQEFYRKNEIK